MTWAMERSLTTPARTPRRSPTRAGAADHPGRGRPGPDARPAATHGARTAADRAAVRLSLSGWSNWLPQGDETALAIALVFRGRDRIVWATWPAGDYAAIAGHLAQPRTRAGRTHLVGRQRWRRARFDEADVALAQAMSLRARVRCSPGPRGLPRGFGRRSTWPAGPWSLTGTNRWLSTPGSASSSTCGPSLWPNAEIGPPRPPWSPARWTLNRTRTYLWLARQMIRARLWSAVADTPAVESLAAALECTPGGWPSAARASACSARSTQVSRRRTIVLATMIDSPPSTRGPAETQPGNGCDQLLERAPAGQRLVVRSVVSRPGIRVQRDYDRANADWRSSGSRSSPASSSRGSRSRSVVVARNAMATVTSCAGR